MKVNCIEEIKTLLEKIGYSKITDISSKRVKIYAERKDRYQIANKIAMKLGGTLVLEGVNAGKPVVDFPGGYRLFVKPRPCEGKGVLTKENYQLNSLQKQIATALQSNLENEC